MTSIAIINSQFPYGSSHAQESLDLVLAAGSFGQQVSVFFVGDGVYQLVKMQSPDSIEQKNISKTFPALTFYDVENVYVCQNSMRTRHLKPDDLVMEVIILEPEQFTETLERSQHVVRF